MAVRVSIATAAFVRDGALLMVHRHPLRRWYPNCWDLVGGHVEPGERPEEALRRECREEVGVHVRDVVPIPMTISDPSIDMSAYLVTSWDGEPVNRAPDEHDDLRWFRPDEIAGLTLADPASLPDILAAVSLGEPSA